MIGLSRGAELALLFASLRRDIAAVIAFSPSSRVWNGAPPYGAPPGPPHPAWTLRGAAVPYQLCTPDPTAPMRRWFGQASPNEAARIRVEAIRGPVLLVASKADTVWPSATYADEIAARLSTRSGRAAVRNLQFDDASHLLMGTGPGITKFQIPGTTFTSDFGETPQGTANALRTAGEAAKRLLASV